MFALNVLNQLESAAHIISALMHLGRGPYRDLPKDGGRPAGPGGVGRRGQKEETATSAGCDQRPTDMTR